MIFEYVKTLFRTLSSKNIENQQITSTKYTVLILRVRQKGHKKSFGLVPRIIQAAKMFGCSHVIAHSLEESLSRQE